MAKAKNGEKMVTLFLFKDSGKYKNDVFVSVNGKRYQIQRGVEVEVPASVAKVLERSMEADQKTASLIEEFSNEYKAESRNYR